MKNSGFKSADRSLEILETFGINPYTGHENLIYAPNRGHTVKYADHVLGLLKEAVKRGKDDFAKTREELIEALKQAGKDFLAESY